ncbi:MAG: GxxExxY protein [Prevotella sp.]|nr:GxxExxY protein [Prevotella sp.]
MTWQEYRDIYEIVGAAMEVHASLGRGLSESIYQEALLLELGDRGLDAEREKRLEIYYKGRKLNQFYVADFYCRGILVELKASDNICSDHRAQLFNYMRVSHTYRGLLINFGEKSLRAERYLYLEDVDDFVLLSQDNYREYITE